MKEEDRNNEGKKKGRRKRKRGIRKSENKENKGNTILTISIPSLPLQYHLYQFNTIPTTSIPSLPLQYHLYHFNTIPITSIHPYHPSSPTSFGRIITINGTLFFIKSILFTCIFSFNQVIPLDIVSFYSFSNLIMMHPKYRKSL